jgi:hypothetical protein
MREEVGRHDQVQTGEDETKHTVNMCVGQQSICVRVNSQYVCGSTVNMCVGQQSIGVRVNSQ